MIKNSVSKIYMDIFNAFPSPVMIVDEDVRIIHYNSAASPMLGKNKKKILMTRAGDVMNCVNSYDSPEGCGRGHHCGDCLIRNSVSNAFLSKTVCRTRHKMSIKKNDKVTNVHMLLTTSLFHHEGKDLVILVIEDINDIIELKRLIPICSVCKKIRTDKEYWTGVEKYFNTHLDVDFSHGYCPECFKSEMKKHLGVSK
ncbi:MAG TPA: PAS domain-containing protein [Victivallales bacterium]|nr:PAS domain-containing protein [Victivallales bacterium]